MNIEEYRDYCLSKKGVSESFPFPKASTVLVFKVLDKMFSSTDIENFASISVKCHPDTIEELRAEHKALIEPSYFNKKHWSFILMDQGLSDKKIKEWIDVSYELVVKNLTKKKQALLEAM